MSKKIAALIFAIAFVVGGFYIFNTKSADKESEFAEVDTNLTLLECDMNANFSCPVKFKGKTVNFSLSPRPVYVMQPVSMWIEGLNELNFKEPSLEIHGVNMEMGVIKAKLEKRDNEYKADVVLSACIIALMRYRFEVLDGGKKTGLYIDFDLKQ
ncbi:hypothetical protein [Campylobacter sp.]|uniref:hypothetical protein n=1 Tax=Campylobacter sp. TaxID=205 RepID=UPI0027016D7F|nr:hypothetical protein [Campylobacter sp.]